MEIRHLRYFVAVAEELHFNRAAERLHVAQPALSFSIKMLEQELGVTLFERTTRSVALSDAGRIFLERARHAVDAFDAARVVGEQLQHGDYGVLSVGGSSQVRQRLSNILKQFSRRYPHMETITREQGTSQILDAVAEGEIDVGLGLATEIRDELSYRTLTHDELVLIVPKGHPLSTETATPLSVLDNERLMLPSNRRARGSNRAILDLCADAGVSPRVTYGNTDHDQRFQSVLEGDGFELKVTDFMLDKSSPGVGVLHLIPPAALSVEIFWRTDRESPHIENFVETAIEVTAREHDQTSLSHA